MDKMVAVELAKMLEQDVPQVKARPISLGRRSVVVAVFRRGGKDAPYTHRC